MASKGAGVSFSHKSYRLTSDTEKSRVTGIVPEKLLNDYLSRIFSPDRASTVATSRYGWVGHPPLSAGPDW